MRNVMEYGVKIGNVVVKITSNQKEAKRVFHQERAKHGGKVKFFEVHNNVMAHKSPK